MVNEVLSLSKPKNSEIYVDCTFGQGGYSKKILENIKCKILAIDRDHESQKYAADLKKIFKKFYFKY